MTQRKGHDMLIVTIAAAALWAALFVIAFAAFATPAAAQSACDTRVNVAEHLARKYSEVVVAYGVTKQGQLIEVLAATNGATWTITVTTPKGMSCLVAEGEGWRQATPRVEGISH